MHIPDGTSVLPPILPRTRRVFPCGAWPLARSARRWRRGAPVTGPCAAFSFLVMMFNIPLPGATTGHAVGGVLNRVAVGLGRRG